MYGDNISHKNVRNNLVLKFTGITLFTLISCDSVNTLRWFKRSFISSVTNKSFCTLTVLTWTLHGNY